MEQGQEALWRAWGPLSTCPVPACFPNNRTTVFLGMRWAPPSLPVSQRVAFSGMGSRSGQRPHSGSQDLCSSSAWMWNLGLLPPSCHHVATTNEASTPKESRTRGWGTRSGGTQARPAASCTLWRHPSPSSCQLHPRESSVIRANEPPLFSALSGLVFFHWQKSPLVTCPGAGGQRRQGGKRGWGQALSHRGLPGHGQSWAEVPPSCQLTVPAPKFLEDEVMSRSRGCWSWRPQGAL